MMNLTMKNNKNNLFLIGPMGSGKSSVGVRLAKHLQWPFYDTDHEVERKAGVDISWIFEMEGESGFRKREADVIASLSHLNNVVLATGGGCVITPSNRVNLSRNGFVIYLSVDLETQFRRTMKRTNHRPLLHTDDPKSKLEQLQKEREHFYLETADLSIATQGNTANEIADMISNVF